MVNYTQPKKKNHKDSPEEWLYSMRAFAKALGFLLKEKEGVVINIDGKNRIIYKKGKQIVCAEVKDLDNVKEGTLVWMYGQQ